MEDALTLPVGFNGKNLKFRARLRQLRYNGKLEVDIGGLTVTFEPDEECN